MKGFVAPATADGLLISTGMPCSTSTATAVDALSDSRMSIPSPSSSVTLVGSDEP